MRGYMDDKHFAIIWKICTRNSLTQATIPSDIHIIANTNTSSALKKTVKSSVKQEVLYIITHKMLDSKDKLGNVAQI